MSNKYKFHNPEGCYFVTYSVVGWVDVFTRNVYKDILVSSWRHCQQHKQLFIHAYVIMTNHVHMIVSSGSDFCLENIMRDLKKFTANQILKTIQKEPESRREWMLEIFRKAGELNSNNTRYQFWKQDNHPIECITPIILQQKMDYIHENPVRAGFVEKVEDWLYSSAGDYFLNRKGLIELSYV